MSCRRSLQIGLFCAVFVLAATARADEGPSFESSIVPLSTELRKAMTGVTWRPGCPVSLDDLALVTINFTLVAHEISVTLRRVISEREEPRTQRPLSIVFVPVPMHGNEHFVRDVFQVGALDAEPT